MSQELVKEKMALKKVFLLNIATALETKKNCKKNLCKTILSLYTAHLQYNLRRVHALAILLVLTETHAWMCCVRLQKV